MTRFINIYQNSENLAVDFRSVITILRYLTEVKTEKKIFHDIIIFKTFDMTLTFDGYIKV